MPEMMQPPQGAPAPEQAPEQGAPQGGGQATQLVAGLHKGMTMLMEMLPEEDKGGLQQIIQAYEQFVTQALGAPGGQAKAPNSAVPMEAGASDVRPAL